MKRNWLVISSLLILIIAYEMLVLGPYNRKYAPPPAPEATANSAASSPAADAPSATVTKPGAPTTTVVATPTNALITQKKLNLSVEEKNQAEKVEISGKRYFSVYPDGSVGDAVFPEYFQRGKEVREPVRIVENAFHFTSSDPRVNTCLRNLKKTSPLNFSGQVEGVQCRVTYRPENLLLGAKLEIESAAEVKGDVSFETDDTLGDGPQFDHRYLTVKKKDEEVERIRDGDLWESDARTSGPYDFLAWGDKYFAAVLLPKGKFNPDVFYKKGSGDGHVNWGVAYPMRWSPESPKLAYEFDLFFARKDLQEVKTVRADLADTIDFGFFGGIARFMLWCLESLYKVFGNYGIAIVILSLVIRLLLWPINKKMFESGQKMKDIAPQMEAIKKKYEGKNDKIMEMNQEIRALYGKAGVNPLGSCFPVLIQIPIFFALNSALSNSVDLYQAPFFGWIQDLSYKDPLYILPIVWTITLIISVELNPQPQSQPGMPDMKWISRVMFLVFGFISKDFPSGLNLYFLVSNVAGMFQQWLFRKKQNAAGSNILLGKER